MSYEQGAATPFLPQSSKHKHTASSNRTAVYINVYDLIPQGKFTSFLWLIGSSLLHSGVVINDKEYAFGAHDKKGISGVYWTKPRVDPPGGTWKAEVLQGFSFATDDEIDTIVREASQKFIGPSWNLLTNNCNNFTSYLCEQLTGRPAPSWLNRAATIGIALPCVVPRQWLQAPDAETADGELVDEEAQDENRNRGATGSRSQSSDDADLSEYSTDEDDDDDREHSHMLASDRRRARREAQRSSRGDLSPSRRRAIIEKIRGKRRLNREARKALARHDMSRRVRIGNALRGHRHSAKLIDDNVCGRENQVQDSAAHGNHKSWRTWRRSSRADIRCDVFQRHAGGPTIQNADGAS